MSGIDHCMCCGAIVDVVFSRAVDVFLYHGPGR
jgi:hypothetical protein